MQWHEALKKVRPFMFRIATPTCTGTGFLVGHSEKGDLFGVATAAHVVQHAQDWEQPIRLEHFETGQILLLRSDKRAILVDQSLDTAAIVFEPGELTLPKNPPELIDETKIVKNGVEVGWLGFPAVSPENLCFFSGRVSCSIGNESAYLIDGVAINGVSGGPTLWLGHDHVIYVGVMSAYIPNRATGESLPGLAVVREVSQFQEVIKKFKSLGEAKKEEAKNPPSESPDIIESSSDGEG